MTERDIKELLGHMVIHMREAEMALNAKDARIADLEKEIAAVKRAAARTKKPRRYSFLSASV